MFVKQEKGLQEQKTAGGRKLETEPSHAWALLCLSHVWHV